MELLIASDSVSLDAQEKFYLLHEILKDYSSGYASYTITTSASILLVIGWLLTSEHARTFLRQNHHIKYPMIFVVLLLFVIEVFIAFNAMSVSADTVRALTALDLHGVESSLWRPRMINSRLTMSFLGGHLFMYAFLSLIIWKVARPNTAMDLNAGGS